MFDNDNTIDLGKNGGWLTPEAIKAIEEAKTAEDVKPAEVLDATDISDLLGDPEVPCEPAKENSEAQEAPEASLEPEIAPETAGGLEETKEEPVMIELSLDEIAAVKASKKGKKKHSDEAEKLIQLKKDKKRSELLEWIKDIAIAVIAAMLILQFITPTLIREHSMENTLFENDYVIVSRKHYSWFGNSPERGDIITFTSDLTTTLGTKKILIKRIIAVPGDTVSIKDGNVYVNGEIADSSYTKDGYTRSEMDEVTVPEGCIFVMGDNRQNSTDSRSPSVGFVEINRIYGKVLIRLLPLSKAGSLY